MAMDSINVEMKNGYVLTREVEENEWNNNNGILLKRNEYQRFAVVVEIPEDEKILKKGDIILKPIGRTTPVKINGVEYDCINRDIIFARLSKNNL